MPRVDDHQLTERFESALAGEPGPLHLFLREHSNLPGPRGNLELAWQFADLVAARAAGNRAAAVWEVVTDLAAVGPDEAPTGDPGEFVAFCGTLAAAGFAGEASRQADVWQTLRRAAEDPRWRLREAAAQGIQRALALDRPGTLAVLGKWAAGGGWLLLRVVAAGIADPPLLADRVLAAAALRLHEVVCGRFTAATNPRDPDFRVLRQGLGFTLSVVVAAAPEPGFTLLRRLAALADRDLAWVLRSNLGKARLARSHPEEVEAVGRLLAG
ncbi:MAG TPA: hypothetical protein VMX37_03850 [Acidimicrobiia bacterium]|nr:hypothetical protein [Acidimicrobiia bacterium]